jgi:hypothetical protein
VNKAADFWHIMFCCVTGGWFGNAMVTYFGPDAQMTKGENLFCELSVLGFSLFYGLILYVVKCYLHIKKYEPRPREDYKNYSSKATTREWNLGPTHNADSFKKEE